MLPHRITLAAAAILAAAVGTGTMLAAQARPTVPIKKLGSVPFYVDDASASPNGRLIAYATDDSGVRVLNPSTGKSTTIYDKGVDILRWSPTGDNIFVVRYNDQGADPHIWGVPVNALTGLAAGEPRRVTAGASVSPFPSPDGKLLAYIIQGADGPEGLAIVPTNGGRETKLAEGPVSYRVGWSPDGAYIYYALNTAPPGAVTNTVDLYRVRATGGEPEPLGKASAAFPGLSNDAKYWFSIAVVPEHGLMTVSALQPGGGVLGTAIMPALTDGRSWLNLGYHALLSTSSSETTISAVNLATGATRAVVRTNDGVTRNALAISPDGRRIAWTISADAGLLVWAANADGTGKHVIDTLPAGGPVALPSGLGWSPDGKYLAYHTAGIGPELFIATAEGRRVAMVTPQLGAVDFKWRADSRGLRYVRQDGTPNKRHLTIHELTLDGKDRLVLDFAKWYNAPPGVIVLDENHLLTIRPTRLHNMDGSEPKSVLDPRDGPDLTLPYVSNSHKQLAFTRRSEAGSSILHVANMTGGPIRDITLPFAIAAPNQPRMQWAPDDRSIFIGSDAPGTPMRIYRVPLDGAAPTVVATAPAGEMFLAFTLSPDGATLYHILTGTVTTTFIDADLSPALGTRAPK
jgi:Tol biopolymer transport system component